MNKVSLRTLVLQRLVTAFSKLRKNSSGYWYMTLLNGSKSFNVYFGKRSTAIIDALGLSEGSQLPAELLKSAEIVLTKNAQDELRYKFTLSGTNDYTSSADMAELFGVEEVISADFDIAALKAQFQAVVANEMAKS